MTVSVIIPTYNRPEALQECLRSVQQQTRRPDDIVVVDDASQPAIATTHGERIIRQPQNRGVAEARNAGAAVAAGDILVFIDDDCRAEPTWLETLLAPIEQGQADFTFGCTEYIARGYRGYFPERLVTNQGGRWPGAANFAVRREAFLTIGGFSDEYLYFHNEDTELAIRLVAKGFSFQRVPTATVIHQPAVWTVRSLLASARNAAVWPRLKRQYPLYYRTFGGDVVGPIVGRTDFILFWLWPIALPFVLLRYIWHGKRQFRLFFTKWPIVIIVRRLYIWREAWRQRLVMI